MVHDGYFIFKLNINMSFVKLYHIGQSYIIVDFRPYNKINSNII